MHNFQVKAGVSLPQKKYIPGFGMVLISDQLTDTQVSAIMATGYCDFFEPKETAAAETTEPETEHQAVEEIESPKKTKKDGKAK